MSTIEPDATVPRRYTQAGDYDLIRKMGSGGFGVVFEARHRRTGLMYALKRVELSAEDAQRFENEALYPAKIASRSLHVLGVQNFFHDPGEDVFYLVTELVPHGDLRSFLDNNPKPLPIAQAIEVAIGIAKGLVAIHAQGIIHRDLKPANVLMDQKDEQWVPKIADFGLARSTNSISIGEFASSGYAAPEQIDLLSEQPLGPESDLFSFGMIVYELLTGQKPTVARDIREYGRWIGTKQMPAPPSTVRTELAQWPQLDTLVASLLQFDRTKRANGAPDVVKTLTQVLRRVESGDQPQTAKPAPDQIVVTDPPPTPTPRPESTSTSAPTESDMRPTEETAWTRRRTLTYMAGVFTVTAVAMTAGVAWKDPSSKFALPAMPLPLFFGAADSAPWYAKVSWLVLPALFGLAVALAVRLSPSRALIVALLSTVAYQLATLTPFLILSAVDSIARANGDTGAGVRDAALWLVPFVAGGFGALFVRGALAPWHRPSRRDLVLTTVAGVVSGGSFLALVSFGLIAPGFVAWQTVVGLLIVDRILFKTRVPARDWSLKPVMGVVVAAIPLVAVGTWARNLPVSLEPGKFETNPKEQALYRWIPPGEFQMGCSADDSECAPDEQPTRKVTFTKGFWLKETEVTVKEWKAAPGERARPLNANWGEVVHNAWDQNPIASVTWSEAGDYCRAMDGRLPTEAEWEYAARAGTNGARYGRLNEIAHHAENSATTATQSSNTALLPDQALLNALSVNRNYASSAGSHQGNAWSVDDMLGNVAEWVEDDYADTTYSVVSGEQTDPRPHLTGVARTPKVVRGGSWGSRPRDVRASARSRQDPDAGSVFVGFRCVWNNPENQK